MIKIAHSDAARVVVGVDTHKDEHVTPQDRGYVQTDLVFLDAIVRS